MSEQRRVCAELLYDDRNCRYAKIVEEKGKYPVINFQAKQKNGVPDFTTIHNVKTRVDTTCFCVYCTHPSYSEEKLIGNVEPYFPSYAPCDCPELQKECGTSREKTTLFQRVKNLFVK